MDAPFAETILRAVAALVFLGVFAVSLRTSRAYQHAPSRWLWGFQAAVVGAILVWRTYLVWVGLQHDADGHYATVTEPYVRAVGVVLLIGLGLSVALLGDHARRHGMSRE